MGTDIIITMKALSLTLTIVIIAIVLLVTALVIMTIFGGQMAQFITIINPWSKGMLESNLCQQRCAVWCQQHIGEDHTGWNTLEIDAQDEKGKNCDVVMREAMGTTDIGECKCMGIPTTDVDKDKGEGEEE